MPTQMQMPAYGGAGDEQPLQQADMAPQMGGYGAAGSGEQVADNAQQQFVSTDFETPLQSGGGGYGDKDMSSDSQAYGSGTKSAEAASSAGGYQRGGVNGNSAAAYGAGAGAGNGNRNGGRSAGRLRQYQKVVAMQGSGDDNGNGSGYGQQQQQQQQKMAEAAYGGARQGANGGYANKMLTTQMRPSQMQIMSGPQRANYGLQAMQTKMALSMIKMLNSRRAAAVDSAYGANNNSNGYSSNNENSDSMRYNSKA